MANSEQPTIPAEKNLPEITLKVIIVAIFLTIVLAIANAYLALKIGMLTAASIPAAVLAMGIFRCFKEANILENNLVQTAASAGEAVAGGIVYTIPALVIIGYWDHFSYWENVAIALVGGLLGVMFSIPLRRILVYDKNLSFPEGRAVAVILQSQTSDFRAFYDMVLGGMVGAMLEVFQVAFKVLADTWQVWVVKYRAVVGFGGGFSAAMIGAGYLIGFRMGLSIMIGAIISYLVSVPIVSYFSPDVIFKNDVHQILIAIKNSKLNYIGIGSLLFSGIWTLLILIKPLVQNIRTSIQFTWSAEGETHLPRTERDIPLKYVVGSIIFLCSMITLLFYILLPIEALEQSKYFNVSIFTYCALTTILLSMIFSALTAYFSGMVGVTATPGQAFIIGGVLISAAGILLLLHQEFPTLSAEQILAAKAITIMMVSMILSACAISIDNMQDLKVGQLVGSTPWKQQVMLMLGVFIASLIIPPIMQTLFNVYGLVGVMPHAGMDPAQTLPAPPAAVLATLSDAVFHHDLPYDMMGIGMLIMVVALGINSILKRFHFDLSLIGLGIGIYLPLKSSVPLFIGGVFALISQVSHQRTNRGAMVACGLVAGAALADVVLAIPFSLFHSPDALNIVPAWWSFYSVVLSVGVTILMALWFYMIARRD